jgi:hypothetical protein
VSGLNLATPDARHRRPLKITLYLPSVKKQRPCQKAKCRQVSDASPWWRDSGHSKGLFAFLTCSYGNGGTKSSKKCRNVTVPPIIMVVRKAFFDVVHSLKDQSKNRRKPDGKFTR